MTMLQRSDEAQWTSEYQVMQFLNGQSHEMDIYWKVYKITSGLMVLNIFQYITVMILKCTLFACFYKITALVGNLDFSLTFYCLE
jgi:hypothetical protein